MTSALPLPLYTSVHVYGFSQIIWKNRRNDYASVIGGIDLTLTLRYALPLPIPLYNLASLRLQKDAISGLNELENVRWVGT